MLISILVNFVPIIIAIVLHEVAHGYAAYLLGDDTAKRYRRLSLNPVRHVDVFGTLILPTLLILSKTGLVFGWAKPVEINPNYYKNFRSGVMKVSFAGPGMNLLICFLAECIMLLMMKLGLLTAGQPGHLFLYWIMLYNVWFAFFNLIPVPPLDGSKILEMVLPGKLAFAFHNFSYRYSFLLLLFLVFSGMIGRIINPLAQFYTGTTIRLIASVLQM